MKGYVNEGNLINLTPVDVHPLGSTHTIICKDWNPAEDINQIMDYIFPKFVRVRINQREYENDIGRVYDIEFVRFGERIAFGDTLDKDKAKRTALITCLKAWEVIQGK